MLHHALALLFLAPVQGGLLGIDEGPLLASDAAPWDRAAEVLDLDGQSAVVGARWQDSIAPDAGAAYTWVRSNGSWSEQQKLTGSDSRAADEFGFEVAIQADTIVVGAPTADVTGVNEGAVYVFTRSAGAWTQQAKLWASDKADDDRFGSSVALDGDTLLVGVPGDDDLGSWSGSAYVYTRTGSLWSQRAKLVAGDGSTGSYFGHAVALEGGTALVGAPGPGGGAYVFVGSGINWLQQAKLTDIAPDASDRFGEAVDLSVDTAAVGSPLDDDNGSDSGSVSIFDRVGTNWIPTTRLVAGELFGELGRSVSLSGPRLAAGAPRDQQFGNTPLGGVYLFEHVGVLWSQAAALAPSGQNSLDDFGAAVALDGELLLVGTPGADAGGTNSGRARAYSLVPGISKFCFGDGSGTPCPCSNTAQGSVGCANSSGLGAGLHASGVPSVTADALNLVATDLLAGQPALLFGGNNAVAGGAGLAFGDGLRCAGGAIVRIGVRIPNATGGATWGPGIAASSGVVSGDTRRYQCWYRDPLSGPCGSGFNLTNGLEVSFVP